MFTHVASITEGDEELIASLDAAQARVGREERELLRFIAGIEESDVWMEFGARDAAHFLSMRLGISSWKARRLIGAALALEDLPHLSDALVSGRLSLDKVAELARFATAEDELGLISWAGNASVAGIRHEGDLVVRRKLQEVIAAQRSRSLHWWYDGEGGFGMQVYLPAIAGATVVRAIERMAESIPAMPDEDQVPSPAPERHADALLALASARLAADPDPDRATVIVHARLDGLSRNTGGAEIENGPVVHPEAVRRLLCDARVQTVVEDEGGNVTSVGRVRREPSAWMARQVRYRDRECRFPGCGARRFTQAHHVRFWRHGGSTDLENLLLICSFHHRLVHEMRWSVTRSRDGTVRWFRPDGEEFRTGPPDLVLA